MRHGGTGLDVTRWRVARRALGVGPFQFLMVAPVLVAVAVVVTSAALGVDHPAMNFGVVATWVLWWGTLLLSFVILGRGWCLVCPIGAAAEWLQRLSLWWRSRWIAGLERRWPRPLRNTALATTLFVVFVYLDNGYGFSNSPRLTAALIAVVALTAAWIALVFERRTFCRWICPLTSFIGVNSLLAAVELRRRDPERCGAACATKDCFRGNDTRWGCPMAQFPGGGMDSNESCILCAECLRACPADNIAVRLRAPARDLWTMRRPSVDGALSAAVVVALATIVPLLTLRFSAPLRSSLAAVLPSFPPPNDLPRLGAVALLFVLGIALTGGLVYGFAVLARRLARDPRVAVRALFTRFAYALVPIALAKLIADLLDHAVRTWGALGAVTRALLLDFPLNRVPPGRLGVSSLLGPVALYGVQCAVLLAGLGLSVFVVHRMCAQQFRDREAAFAAFVPMSAFGMLLTWMSVWLLGIPLL